jgi:hypothetical protein
VLTWLAGGVLAALALYAALRWFAAARASDVAQALRTFAAVFSALASTGLIFAGRWGPAIVTVAATAMAIRALVNAGRGADPIGDGGGADDPDAAAVETALLAMRLDRRTGRIDGTVRAGPRKGQALGRLGLPALLELLEEARRDDPPSVDLLEAYLDRREPGWRERGPEGGAAAGAGAAPAATMDEATALEILGLQRGASAEEVKAAHRALMAKLHPDRGGSTYLASQINQAKDLLLGRSRSR